MTALNSEKQTKKSLGTLLELILKVLAGLISAVIVPSVVLFLLVTLMSIFSAVYEQQGIKGTELLHNNGISFAVAFFGEWLKRWAKTIFATEITELFEKKQSKTL